MTIKLPKDFFFGAAMSGPQTEGAWNVGGRLRSYWDMYSDQEINAFFNNVGSYVGNDMYHKYEEDIKLLKSLNFKSFRTSMQWTRLLDQDGKLNPEGAAVELATELLKESGARMVIPLKVSGPFHTSLLNEASIKLENEFNNIEFNDPKIKTITNVTADFINDKTEIKNLLINQVKSSVRWSETIEKMIDEGIDTFIEIGPLKTLSSFVREISKEKKTYVKIFNVEDLKSLNKTLEGMEAIC